MRSAAGESNKFGGGGRTTPMLGLKPIPIPTSDGSVDRGCEKGRDRHNRVLGDLEESIIEQRHEDQQTKNPIHRLSIWTG